RSSPPYVSETSCHLHTRGLRRLLGRTSRSGACLAYHRDSHIDSHAAHDAECDLVRHAESVEGLVVRYGGSWKRPQLTGILEGRRLRVEAVLVRRPGSPVRGLESPY